MKRELTNRQKLERRIRYEKAILKATIDVALKAGYSITVSNGEENTIDRSKDKKEIFNACMSTDEDYLFFYVGDQKIASGWVFFIYGNDGWDVINDYTVCFEELLKPVHKLINKFEKESRE